MNREVDAIDIPVRGPSDAADERAYTVALRLAGMTSVGRLRDMQNRFGSSRGAWEATAAELRSVLGGREKMLAGLLGVRTTIEPAKELEKLERMGVQVVTIDEPGYPSLLAEIGAPPPVLFLRGSILETDVLAVAIVGTRAPSAYGRDMARSIARDLARAGVTIVSGLARGIDGIAHEAALETGGRTLAVLGSGIHDVYPREHRNLSRRIGEQGAVISDNLPNAKPDRWNFPARNRIISGLSRGVLVVEAPEKSGALITVDFAADQGRDVFAVPGLATSVTSAGTNKMIRDGARLVRDAADILEDLLLFATTPVRDAVRQPALLLDDDERRLLGLLTSTPLHIDEIVDASGLPLPRVSAILLSLELQDHVVNTGSQHYCRL
jgi:DNA processing protein